MKSSDGIHAYARMSQSRNTHNSLRLLPIFLICEHEPSKRQIHTRHTKLHGQFFHTFSFHFIWSASHGSFKIYSTSGTFVQILLFYEYWRKTTIEYYDLIRNEYWRIGFMLSRISSKHTFKWGNKKESLEHISDTFSELPHNIYICIERLFNDFMEKTMAFLVFYFYYRSKPKC